MSRSVITKEKFIERSILKHGSKYVYDNVIIEKSSDKVLIICPDHGGFYQQYRKHLSGQGCKKCGNLRQSLLIPSILGINKEQWFIRAKEKHGDRYNYSLVTYLDFKTKVDIICPIHGVFSQNPRRHLDTGGCYQCGRENTSIKTRNKYDLTQLVAKFNIIHNNKYTYPNLHLNDYSTVNETKIEFVCPDHGIMSQRLSSHLNGNGCDKCRYFGYTRTAYVDNCLKRGHSKSSYYAVKFYNEFESFIKLGITTQGVKTRYRKIKERGYYNYEVLFDIPLSPGDAWDIERENKSKFISLKYLPENGFPGSTECFTMELPVEEIRLNINKNHEQEIQTDK